MKFLLGLLLSLWVQSAVAGVSCTVPFTFVNGTTADANQVNANYAALVACLLNAAGAGNNNDITALLALTTPITPAGGGTSLYTAAINSAGTANAQTIAAPSPTGFTLTRGLSILFTAGFTNTAAMQINVNGTGLTNLYKPGPSGPQAMIGGEVIANDLVWAVYDGTQFQLINSGAQFGGFGPQVTLASATTTDLGTVPTHNVVVSGVTTITGFGSTATTTYPVYKLAFTNNLVLTYNATSLILPGAKNITTQPNDTAEAMYLGSGNWAITSYSPATGASVANPVPLCGFSGLALNNGASNSIINWSYTSSVLISVSGNIPTFGGAKSGTINITTGTSGTSTAGGMDGSSPGNNTFTYTYAIYNGTTWSAVGSTQVPSVGPTMPAGYTSLCYMGAIKTNGSGNLYGTQIQGNRGWYVNGGANLTGLPSIANGSTEGTSCATSTPAPASFTIRGSTGAGIWVPATAVSVGLVVFNAYNGGAVTGLQLSPSAGYSGGTTGPNPAWYVNASIALSQVVRMNLESSAVLFCAAGAGNGLFAYDWTDQVNAN